MAHCPPAFFFLADERTPVEPGGRRWHFPLPVQRRRQPGSGETPAPAPALRYGDYFTAAADFLLRQHLRPLAAAASKAAGSLADPPQIRELRIFLEKHGAFYHPAKVVLLLEKTAISMVLNVAVSRAGQRLLTEEYGLLKKLGKEPLPWLPRVFGCGSGKTLGGQALPMFLAQWFDGFCEFHLTADGGMVLWDPACGPRPVSADNRRELYRKVARIFGDYYRLETGARIHPWHHGAGDFIARIDSDGIALRLVTARGYPAVATEEAGGVEWMLRELLVAFLELSIRTRIDRVDGTGELVWAETAAVEPTLVGFVEALADKPPVAGHFESAAILLVELLADMPAEAMVLLGREALAGFGQSTAEFALASEKLPDHLRDLNTVVRGLSVPLF